jgi:hypothetical protein
MQDRPVQVLSPEARPRRRPRHRLAALLLAGALGPALAAHGEGAGARAREPAVPASRPDQLAVQVNDDRLTLAVAKVPQVYLYGPIDAGAPQRFEALVREGKIPQGADIYLNSSGGDVRAGLALGRLFRAGSMATHLGVPRRSRLALGPKIASCLDACAYAYAGGLFRWAATGSDRFGVQPLENLAGQSAAAPQLAAEIHAYLRELVAYPLAVALLTPPARGAAAATITPDQMRDTWLANNGRLPTTASYNLLAGAPMLTLSQTTREGEHRLTLLCKPDGLTLTASNALGALRARQMAVRANLSYLEIDQQRLLPQEARAATSAAGQSLVIERSLPRSELPRLLAAHSVGAWLADRGGAVRYGFTLWLDGVRAPLGSFAGACGQPAVPKRNP